MKKNNKTSKLAKEQEEISLKEMQDKPDISKSR